MSNRRGIFSSLRKKQKKNLSRFSNHFEELNFRGYTIFEHFVDKSNLGLLSKEIDNLYKDETKDFGIKNLKKINDEGVLRSPFLKSNLISKIIFSNKVQFICDKLLDRNYILHVNRAVLNNKNIKHPAMIWHRDLPYQSPSLISIQALTFIHFINDSNSKNGGVALIPNSNKWDSIPSQKYLESNFIIPDIKAGSLLVFDSTLLHSTSKSFLPSARRALVTIFSIPMFKQHINYASQIDLKKKHKFLNKINNINFLIGKTTNPFNTEREYRLNKLYKNRKVL